MLEQEWRDVVAAVAVAVAAVAVAVAAVAVAVAVAVAFGCLIRLCYGWLQWLLLEYINLQCAPANLLP